MSAVVILALATVLARGDWFWAGREAWRLPVLTGFALVAGYEAVRGLLHLRRARRQRQALLQAGAVTKASDADGEETR